jgi:hypothetical protein
MLHKSLVPPTATGQLATGKQLRQSARGLVVGSLDRANGAIHYVDKISRI